MKRITLTGIGKFFVAFLAALSFFAMVYFAYKFWKIQTPDFANAFTGAGAVLAASISALVAFRSISIAEETQKPYPYPYIDVKSRYGLSLMKLKNAGGSAAHRIYLEWEGAVPMLRQGDDEVSPQSINFAGDEVHAISVLMPGEEQATVLGVHHWVAQQLKGRDKELKGHIVFQDVKGNSYRQPFFVDTSFYQWALADETELIKAQYALSKVPDVLAQMSMSLEKISQTLKS